jgi:hypothetical protein
MFLPHTSCSCYHRRLQQLHYHRNEFWSHSDGDGHFYVIDLKDTDFVKSKVKAHAFLPFHGKLLWDEDGTLGDRGFATSTGEQLLFEIDIANASLARSYNYSANIATGSCLGLRAIAYSSVNQHIYAECTRDGGILEFDVSDDSIEFVHQHIDQTGSLYEVPDGSYVVATNKGGDTIFTFSNLMETERSRLWPLKSLFLESQRLQRSIQPTRSLEMLTS